MTSSHVRRKKKSFDFLILENKGENFFFVILLTAKMNKQRVNFAHYAPC